MKKTWFLLGLSLLALGVSAGPGKGTRVPPWDKRGVGPLPFQGIACLDYDEDSGRVAVGTIAPPGDPNVIVLDGMGKIEQTYKAGQRWINQVAFAGKEVLAICTMPEGRAGDRPQLYRLADNTVRPEKISLDRDWFFHYGDHSNHTTTLLAREGQKTAVLWGNQVLWPTSDKPGRIPLGQQDLSVSVATGGGITAVGTTAGRGQKNPNLVVLSSNGKTLWSRPVNTETARAPALEKGEYGQPTLPDGRREDLPQHDDPIWAPLAVAVHADPKEPSQWQVAAADYQGWLRWVRSSATQKDQDLGPRFMPAKPAITVYGPGGKVSQRFGPESFPRPMWCNLRFTTDGRRLLAWPHSWTCRGLADQSLLPADDNARDLYILDLQTGKVAGISFPDAISDLAISHSGTLAAGCWDGRVYILTEKDLKSGRLPAGFDVGGPSLVAINRDGTRIVSAMTGGILRLMDSQGKGIWTNDLNRSIKPALKPWVANARAIPLGKGVWQIPGGRVESDLGGQWLIEAPDGLILIEGHAGLSFDREWHAIAAVGLDPRRVKYILATHEHGDHAPGAYLWRVVTGAQFVCSKEMAYTLRHHIPGNTGYGFHPPVPTDIKITKDTDLDLAGMKMGAVRIPGHTNGSMALRFEKGGKTYVSFGDLIMPKGVLGYSGSINFSARDVLASLRKLQALKPDVVLPGHGAVGPPLNTLAAGVDVAQAGGWGLFPPEKPDPYFRIRQKNVVVAAWNLGAASMAFGDIDGDGKPDLAMVAPTPKGSVLKIFLNKGGKFDSRPDHALVFPIAKPHKVRIVPDKKNQSANLFVAGESAVILFPDGKFPAFRMEHLALGDGNHLRIIGGEKHRQILVTRRFGGVFLFNPAGKNRLQPFHPEIKGPYVDIGQADVNGDGRPDLVTSYGQIYLRRKDGSLPVQPSQQLPVEKGDWSYFALGDFNADGGTDIALLSYGMNGQTSARVFYQRNQPVPFASKPDAILSLNPDKKNKSASLVRDSAVAADWNGDGIADLVVAHGQADQVLVLFGGKDGLKEENFRIIPLDYRVHYETGIHVEDFNSDGRPDLAVYGYTLTGVGWNGPPAGYIWLQTP